MGGFFGGSKAPVIIPPPPAPEPEPMPDPEATKRAEKRKALLRRQRRGGRSSTILSDDTGDSLGG